MIGFRFRFKIPPDQPGDPKIFLPRIVLLIPGFLLLCFGLWEVWRYFQLPVPADGGSHGLRLTLNLMDMNLQPRSIAGVCAVVFLATGALFFSLGLLAERTLRMCPEAPDENSAAFVSARKFTIAASLISYLYLFGFVVGPWLSKFLPGIAVAFIWVATAGALCSVILRFAFRKGRGEVNR